jgi:hypothetical protein
MLRNALALVALVILTACGTTVAPNATDEEIKAARYSSAAPASITLFTVVSTKNGSGAHSGLLINGSQRVLFDPAGSFYHPRMPERADVHHGMNDKMVAFYIDYHARVTYDVIEQTVLVPQSVADAAIAAAYERGPVAKSMCANSISGILASLPGFENIGSTWFPNALSESFGALPGVTRRKITDTDADNNHGVLLVDPNAYQPKIKSVQE